MPRLEDLGVTEARDGLLDRRDAEGTVECDRDVAGQDASARPVHHCPRSFLCEARSIILLAVHPGIAYVTDIQQAPTNRLHDRS
jgi:hypothetical protein